MLSRRSLHWSSLVILSSGLLPVDPVGVLAQATTASCLSTFNWMTNSKNQSPCLLSAYLQGACNGGQFTVPSLPSGTHYTGPYADEQNPCQCSSVTYNVVSACGLCQNHTIVSWSVWDTNCSTVYPGVFPPGVPDGTAIPQWAFQDVSTSNSFNVTLAQSIGDNPESIATRVQSTGSSLAATSVAASLTASPSASSSAPSGNKSDSGAIAGGVIGGVVGVALIAGVIVFFVMKRKRSQIPPSAQFAGDQMAPIPSSAYADTTPFASQIAQPRFYDPSDPSTFPASPPPTTVRTGASSYDVPSSPYYSSPPVRPGGPGHYTGMPEI